MISYEFRKITIDDKDEIKKRLKVSDSRGCEYSFANNLAWHRSYNSYICLYKDYYICASFGERIHYIFPSGVNYASPDTDSLREVFAFMREYAAKKNMPYEIGSLNDINTEILKKCVDDDFVITECEDENDYIYKAEDLALLKGKKYHNKRNLIRKLDGINAVYSEMNEKDFDDCIEFAAKHYDMKNGYDDNSQIGEQFAINTFFGYFDRLDLFGGVLRIDGKVAAFTIGEKINSDTVDIHTEKADPNTVGAYQLINRCFAEYIYNNNIAVYINREEDLGIDGLRQSKRSYHPDFMQIKRTAVF